MKKDDIIVSENARTGIFENNPIHAYMLWTAKEAKRAFVVKVVVKE